MFLHPIFIHSADRGSREARKIIMKKVRNLGIFFIVLAIVSCQKPELEIGDDMIAAYGEEFSINGFSIAHSPQEFFEEQTYWYSSNSNIVQVLDSEGGEFYACGVGEADIYLDLIYNGGEKLSASRHVTVVDMKVTLLELDTASCVLFPNDKIRLTATYEPLNASFPEISWISSDEEIATVNSEGEVNAVNVGECTITVKEGRSGLTAQCQITVVPVEMTSLELSETNCRIEIGETHSIVASFEPDNVTFPELYWHSSDESVAIVTNGLVEAVGVGDCVIYVTNADNSLSAKCDVSVYVIEMTTISCVSEKVMEQYDNFRLDADYQPMDATYGLRWYSSDESVATVDELTGEVNCVGIGECDITISNLYSSAIASCHLTVTPATVKNLSLSESLLYLPIGDTERLYCWVEPDYAYNQSLKWKSSDTSVMTVSEDGAVTAVGAGSATLTVTALDGSGCTAECTVVVGTEATLRSHVENYLTYKISITTPTVFYNSCYYVFKNTGNEVVLLSVIKYKISDAATASNAINKYLGPGDTWERWFEIRGVVWTVEMYGLRYTITT